MNIGMVGTGSIAHTMAKEFARLQQCLLWPCVLATQTLGLQWP